MHVSDAMDDDGVVTKVVELHATYGVRLLLNVGEIQDALGNYNDECSSFIRNVYVRILYGVNVACTCRSALTFW